MPVLCTSGSRKQCGLQAVISLCCSLYVREVSTFTALQSIANTRGFRTNHPNPTWAQSYYIRLLWTNIFISESHKRCQAFSSPKYRILLPPVQRGEEAGRLRLRTEWYKHYNIVTSCSRCYSVFTVTSAICSNQFLLL